MKRVVAVLCVLAVGVFLLLMRSPGKPVAGPGPSRAPANRPARSTAYPVVPPPPVAPTMPAAGPPPAGDPASGLKDWAPHGRVIQRVSGEPIFWTALKYQVRLRASEESAGSWSFQRGSPADGDVAPKDPGTFDLRSGVASSTMDVHTSREDLAVVEFRVLARAPGFRLGATDWIRWIDFPRDRDLILEMDIDAPSQLLARVRTGGGAPFRGRATLFLLDEVEFENTDPVEADAEGILVFAGLPSGKYRVSVNPLGPPDASVIHINGDRSDDKEILLPPGGRAEADFVLAHAGEMVVDVAALDGSPVEAWVVDYQFQRGSGSGGSSPRRLTGCPPGDYEVKVWSKGFLDWRTTVRVDAGATARVEARLERVPWSDFLKRVPDEVYTWLDRSASELAKGDSLDSARAALVRSTREEVWDHLVAVSGFQDKAVEARSAFREAWSDRPMEGGGTTTYGSGSFVVLAGAPGMASPSGDPEAWWKGASTEQRRDWLLSWCAEKGGLLEVVRTGDDPCPECAGLVRRTSPRPSTDGGLDRPCPVCNGAKVVRTVRWR